MPWKVKGQNASRYLPSQTRSPSKLSPVRERNENAKKRWNNLRQKVKRMTNIQRNIRTQGFAQRGRFKVTKPNNRVMLWNNAPPGLYFLRNPQQKGRFFVENVGYVPFRHKNNVKRVARALSSAS